MLSSRVDLNLREPQLFTLGSYFKDFETLTKRLNIGGASQAVIRSFWSETWDEQVDPNSVYLFRPAQEVTCQEMMALFSSRNLVPAETIQLLNLLIAHPAIKETIIYKSPLISLAQNKFTDECLACIAGVNGLEYRAAHFGDDGKWPEGAGFLAMTPPKLKTSKYGS